MLSYDRKVKLLPRQQYCHSFLTTEHYYCWQNNSFVIPFFQTNSNIAGKTTVSSFLSYNRTIILLAKQQYCHSFLTTGHQYCCQNNSIVIPFLQHICNIACKTIILSLLSYDRTVISLAKQQYTVIPFLQQNSNISAKTTVLSFFSYNKMYYCWHNNRIVIAFV